MTYPYLARTTSVAVLQWPPPSESPTRQLADLLRRLKYKSPHATDLSFAKDET